MILSYFCYQDQYTKQAGEDMKRFTTELKEYQQTEEYKNILAKKRSEREAAGSYANSWGSRMNKNKTFGRQEIHSCCICIYK